MNGSNIFSKITEFPIGLYEFATSNSGEKIVKKQVAINQKQEKSALTSLRNTTILEGSRNDTLARIVGYIKFLGLPKEGAFTLVKQIISNKMSSGFDEAEANNVVDSIYSYDGNMNFPNSTDDGRAELIAAIHGDNLIYCYDFKKWLIWNGNFWELDEGVGAAKMVLDVAKILRGMAENLTEERAEIASSIAKNLENRHPLQNALHMLAIKQKIKPSLLDTNQYLFSCENGVYDCKNLEFREARKKDYITTITKVEYNQNASSELWEGFINRIFNNNPNLIKYIQKMVGYWLTGGTERQEFYIFYGEGQTGKSTFLGVIAKMMGAYATTTNIMFLCEGTNDPAGNALAAMRAKRLVIFSEPDSVVHLKEALIKELTGEKYVKVRELYGQFFDMLITFKMAIQTNHLPHFRNIDKATWRRIRLIPFTVSIPDSERDMNLEEKLTTPESLSAILKWAIEGQKLYALEGLNPPPEVLEASKQYKDEMDIVGQFIDEYFNRVPNEFYPNELLYKGFQAFIRSNGYRDISQIELGRRLTSLGLFRAKEKGSRGWLGIRMKNEEMSTLWRSEFFRFR